MPQVKQFDVYKAKEELKRCPKIVRDYVKLLEGHLEKQRELTGKAIGKLVGVSRENQTKEKQDRN